MSSVFGPKTSMAMCYEALSYTLNMILFFPYKEDPDIWIQDIGVHYQFITIYYDDLLVLIKYTSGTFRILNTLFPMNVVANMLFYLVSDMGNTEINDEVTH